MYFEVINIFVLFIVTLLKSVGTATFCMTTSAFLAFMISRYMFRSWFTGFIQTRYPKFEAYNRAIKTEGIKFVFLI